MLTVTPSGGALGAHITGVDLTQLAERDFAGIEQALLTHLVIGIRGQQLTPANLLSFSRRFGELEPHVLSQYHHRDHPEILVLSNVVEDGKPRGLADGGSYWHSDLSYMKVPTRYSILYALEVPDSGGDTLFLNMYAAYQALPRQLQQRLESLQAVHNYSYRHTRMVQKNRVRAPLSEQQKTQTPDVVHPAVRTHPETGKRALFINPGFTVGFLGMSEADSDALKAELFEHAFKPELQFAYRWQAGDVLLWDNRCVMHSATAGYTQNRTMYRTTVRGSVPYFDAAAVTTPIIPQPM